MRHAGHAGLLAQMLRFIRTLSGFMWSWYLQRLPPGVLRAVTARWVLFIEQCAHWGQQGAVPKAVRREVSQT